MHGLKHHFQQPVLYMAVVAAAMLGHIDTASAQNTLAFSPSQVTFTSQVNQNPLPQNVTVTLNGAPVSFTSTITYQAGQTNLQWLTSTTTVTGTQSFITLIPNSAGLPLGTYNATVTVTANGITGTIPVTLGVYANASLTADQTNLTFTASVNGTAPSAQVVNISSSTPGLPFSASVTSGSSFLTVAQSSTVTPGQVTIGVNTSALQTAGTLTGTVTVTSPNVAPVTINVTLTVSAQPVIVADINPVNIIYQSGTGAAAPTVSDTIRATSGSFNFVAQVTYPQTNVCGPWLNATGLVGTTPAAITLQPILNGLAATQSCSAQVTVTAPGAADSPYIITVNLSVSPQPILAVYPTSASFSYSIGGTLPPAQSFSVTSTTPLNYSVSSNLPWLSIPATPPNGFTTPSNFTLSLNPQTIQTLNAGTYNGVVTITGLGSGISPVNIPVQLTVSNNPLLIVSPSFATFNYQLGQTLAPQNLQATITSTVGSLPFTLSVPTTTSQQFVVFSPSTGTATTTPTPITISFNPAAATALGAGTFTNTITVTSGTNPPQQILVTLNVSNTPVVNVSPQTLMFNYAIGGAPPAPQALALSSTSSTLSVQATSNQPWLLVSNAAVNTPTNVAVSIAPAGLTIGTYTGVITLTSGSQTPITVPVTLNITSGITLSAAPGTLMFTQAANGPAPATQAVTLTTTGGQSLSYSATTSTTGGGNWLTVNGSTAGTFQGTAPGTLTVAVNGATLAPGTYSGSVNISAVGATNSVLSIPVTLTVSGSTGLAANPTSLIFTGAVAGAAPQSQPIAVSSTTGSPVPFTVAAQAMGGNWLTVSPATGTTPGTVTVTANQAGLAAGSYMGTVTLTSTAAGATPLTIPVMLTVGAQATPVLSNLINAASGAPVAVSPGEIVSLFGTGLGPVTPLGTMLTPNGNVSTTLGNVTVTFNGVAAPLTYVSATQINAVVPYELNGSANAQVVVNFNGLATPGAPVSVTATSPGVFTANASGSGPGAILNQNSTVNTAGNPAAKGSVVVLFATGEGITTPAVPTGSVTGTTPAKPNLPVAVSIGGQPASVLFAGAAPGDVAGVLQVNVVVPTGVASGAVPVVVTVGTVSSQANVTVAVQ